MVVVICWWWKADRKKKWKTFIYEWKVFWAKRWSPKISSSKKSTSMGEQLQVKWKYKKKTVQSNNKLKRKEQKNFSAEKFHIAKFFLCSIFFCRCRDFFFVLLFLFFSFSVFQFKNRKLCRWICWLLFFRLWEKH